MQRYEMVEKGKQDILLTTNNVTASDIKVYKLYTNNNVLSYTDITPSTPTITSLASNSLKQFKFNAPNEDCYLLTIFNGYPQFFRVGTPTLRIFIYAETTGRTINHKLLTFSGSTVSEGPMSELGAGIYYITPASAGDYVFMSDLVAPIPVHTSYTVDSVGMSGKIVFQKDDWMLLSLPQANLKISDVVASIEAKYGVSGSTIFRVFSAYPSTSSQSKEMLDYKPGVTPNTTKYNFSLVYSDVDPDTGAIVKEITGFWCKTNNYTVNSDPNELVVYEWHN